MKKIIYILFVFASCNSSSERANPIVVSDQPLTDSISLIVDSLKEWSENISDISSYAIQAKSEIKKLQQENKELAEKAGEVVPLAMMYSVPSDVKDKQIRDLVTERNFLKSENTRLKNIIYSDSLYRSRPAIGQKLREIIEPEKPNENSLVIVLTGKVVDPKVSVYLVPYKGSSKIRTYEATCDIWYLNSLLAKRASYYNGEYFFNDIVSGKYVVKVCAYYGNWTTVKKKSGYQKIEIDVSPPIQ
jgi:regulator of replication initiation timing